MNGTEIVTGMKKKMMDKVLTRRADRWKLFIMKQLREKNTSILEEDQEGKKYKQGIHINLFFCALVINARTRIYFLVVAWLVTEFY